MNELYPFVENVVKKYSHDALIQLFQHLTQHPGEGQGQLFTCSVNQEYVIKRLIAASLSREGEVKFNAYLALSTMLNHVPHLKAALNTKSVASFIITQTDIKKNCGGKSSQIQAYSIGKVLIIKALSPLFIDNIEIINHLIELCGEFADLQEQIIDLLGHLVHSKKSQLAFSKLNPNTKSGFVLFTILKNRIKGTKAELNEAVVADVLGQLLPQYPRRSICLSYLGQELKHFGQNPGELIKWHFESALGTQTEEPNVKKIFYILQLLESHLAGVTISSENVLKMINAELLGSWFSQLKVQNKIIRKQAESITISFEQNSELAFNILKKLHSSNVNLSNLNIKHPLFQLLEMVDPQPYFQYLLDLCSTESSEMDTEEEPAILPWNQLELFITVTYSKIKAESIAKAIQLFVNSYQNKKDQNNLQALNSIFNSIIPHNQKKKQTLFTKQSLILAKINFQQLDLGQPLDEVKKAIKDIRNQFKQIKEEQNPFIVSYLNFMLNVGFYFLLYPEEVEIFNDLKMAFDDIKANILSQQSGLIPKKKRKLNPQSEKNKPIHILVDIFISLLTKSPHYLRNAINQLFEQIIPYVDTEDLSHLMEVVERPDQEYIEQIENQ